LHVHPPPVTVVASIARRRADARNGVATAAILSPGGAVIAPAIAAVALDTSPIAATVSALVSAATLRAALFREDRRLAARLGRWRLANLGPLLRRRRLACFAALTLRPAGVGAAALSLALTTAFSARGPSLDAPLSAGERHGDEGACDYESGGDECVDAHAN